MDTKIRKFSLYFFSIILAMLVFAPLLSHAVTTAEQARCDALKAALKINANSTNMAELPANLVTGLPDYCTVDNVLLIAINIALVLAGSVAVLFLIIGGFWYLTSSGNDEQAEKGRKTLVNAIIGLVVVIMSFAIVQVVVKLLTANSS